MIFLAVYTGSRKKELAALSWNDLDFKNKEIQIRHSIKYDRDAKKYINGSTKTDKAVRDILISDIVIGELKCHKACQAKSNFN